MWIYGKDFSNLKNLYKKIKIGTFFVCDYAGEDEVGIILSFKYNEEFYLQNIDKMQCSSSR